MDPSGLQNRHSLGKRRRDAYCQEEVVHDIQKISRRWMPGRGDEIDSKEHLSQVNQALEFRGMSVDHWMRMQQQQQKMESAASTTPLNNLQQPLNLQQRAMATAVMHDVVRNADSSNQTLLPPTPSPQQSGAPQQSAHQQQISQMSQMGQMGVQVSQVGPLQQQTCTGGVAQVHNKFQHLNSAEHQMQQQQQQMPFLDMSGSSSRQVSTLQPLPMSFRPPPIFAEADLRHSPTSSSSSQYPLQNVMSHQQQQRLSPQGSTLLSDPDEDRYSSRLSNQSMLSNQSSVLQQQQHQQSSNTGGLSGISGMSGTSNSLVGLQELQASAAWYPSLRELDTQPPPSSSRLGRVNLPNSQSVGQNVSLYSSPTLSDLTSQSGFAPLPYQSCPSGSSSFRESPLDQDQLLGSDPQSPLPYGVAGCSSSSSVAGPNCSPSPLPRLNNKPVFQTDLPRRGGGMMNVPYSASSSSGTDLLSNSNIMSGGSGLLLDENCFIQRAPPIPKRTYTKVYKMGAIGRALDVTRFCNYTELRCELARMFNLEGQLDQNSGWQLVFLDNENDILLVGDDPWDEFVTSVRGIRILSPSEVFYYMNDERFGAAAHIISFVCRILKQYY